MRPNISIKSLMFLVGLYFILTVNWSYAQQTESEIIAQDKFKKCQELARRGDITEQLRLGNMYEAGHGTEQNLAQAVQWYRRSAESGNAEAQYQLAFSYDLARGVNKDMLQAAAWYHKAAIKGHQKSQFQMGHFCELGLVLEKDLGEAVRWYQLALKQGSIEAWGRLRWLAESELRSNIDLSELATWYEKLSPNEEQLGVKVRLYRELAEGKMLDSSQGLLDEIVSVAHLANVSISSKSDACKLFNELASNGADHFYLKTKSILAPAVKAFRADREVTEHQYENAIDILSVAYRGLGETNEEESLIRSGLANLDLGDGVRKRLRDQLVDFLVENGEPKNAISILEPIFLAKKSTWSSGPSLKETNWIISQECNRLAAAYVSNAQPAKALELYKVAYAQFGFDVEGQEFQNAVAKTSSYIVSNLADLNHKAGRYPRSLELRQFLLPEIEKKPGFFGFAVPATLRGMAKAHDKMGADGQAADLYRKSRSLWFNSKAFKDANYKLTGKPSYARFLFRTGNSKLAEEVLIESVDERASVLKNKLFHLEFSTDLLDPNWTLSDFYFVDKQFSKAIENQESLQRNSFDYVLNRMAFLPRARRESYLENRFRPEVQRALTIGYRNSDDSHLAARSADWLVNGKSLTQEVLAEAALITGEKTAPKLGQLLALRTKLATLSLVGSNLVDEAKELISKLELQEARLENEIVAAVSRGNSKNVWKSSGTIMSEIPLKSHFISIVKLTPYNFEESFELGRPHWDAERYVAWTIPALGNGDVRCIDLGLAKPIDELTDRVRAELYKAPKKLADGNEQANETNLKKLLVELSALVYQPLAAEVKNSTELIISPDSNLWLIPWQLLVDGDQYLVEKKQIRYVTSGREIGRTTPRLQEASQSAVFANPDYDHSSRDTGIAMRQTMSPQARGGVSRRFETLLYSGAEADAIVPSIAKFTGIPPKKFVSGEAQERSFKKLVCPKILAISTHGFFNTDKTITNPLLRCGLALAGANDPRHVGDEDGILSGLEITGIDFRGTELVVLSACDIGVGDIRNGEGVAGLRQAFQLAGAESVLASLWQVDDAETARLMNLFFDNLAKGMTKSEALRQAQLTRIKARRARHGAAHPFFWAAFTLTGQD